MLLVTPIFGQKYEDATITLSNGTSLEGLVLTSFINLSSDKIFFKSYKNTTPSNYETSQIKSILLKVSNRKFLNINAFERELEITENNTFTVIKESNKLFELLARVEDVFLMKLDEKFYIYNEDTSSLNTLEKEVKMVYSTVQSTRNVYQEDLQRAFNDCMNITRKIELTKLSYNSLTQLFKYYSECKNAPLEIYDNKKYNAQISVAIYGGYNSSSITKDDIFINAEKSSGSNAGIAFNYIPKSRAGLVMFRFGIEYNDYGSLESLTLSPSNLGENIRTTYTYDLSTLDFKLQSFLNVTNTHTSKLVPYLGGGLSYQIIVDDTLTGQSNDSESVDRNFETAALERETLGLHFEAGINYKIFKNQGVNVALSYISGSKVFALTEKLRVNATQFKVGYFFQF